MMTLKELIARFPMIPWAKPVEVKWPDCELFACRVCIAQKGLKYDSGHQWPSRLTCVEHILTSHKEIAA